MVEKIINAPEIIKIEKPGVFGTLSRREFKEKLKWESLTKKADNSTSFKGFLKGRIKVARFEDNEDVAELLEFILKRYNEYEK